MTGEISGDSGLPKVQEPNRTVRGARSMRARYSVEREEASSAPGYWLERDGRQLLAGPRAVLEQFADLLVLMDPPERTLPDVMRALMQMTRGCIFVPGEALRRLGRGSAL